MNTNQDDIRNTNRGSTLPGPRPGSSVRSILDRILHFWNTSKNKLIKRLTKVIQISFKKIRISERPDREVDELFAKRNILKK